MSLNLTDATVKKFLEENKLTSNWDSFVIHNTKQQGNNNDADKDLRVLVKSVSENADTREDLETGGKPDAIKYFLEVASTVDNDAAWQRMAARVFPVAANSSEPRKTESLEDNDGAKQNREQVSALPVSGDVPVALSTTTDVYIKSNIEDGCHYDISVVGNGTTYHVQCPLRLKYGRCIVHSESKVQSNMWTTAIAIEMDEFKRSKSEQVETVVKKIQADLSKVTDGDLTALTDTMSRLTLAVSLGPPKIAR